jgi:RNA polymerase I-specific transcription initiation factor RRN3
VGSFISRANFIGIECIRSVLSDLTKWALLYLESTSSRANPDADIHGLFYSVCQSVFYIICFHHELLFAEKLGLNFARSLELEKIASSPLNPLKFCLVAVVNEFGRICSTVGLVTVCEVIEKVRDCSYWVMYIRIRTWCYQHEEF